MNIWDLKGRAFIAVFTAFLSLSVLTDVVCGFIVPIADAGAQISLMFLRVLIGPLYWPGRSTRLGAFAGFSVGLNVMLVTLFPTVQTLLPKRLLIDPDLYWLRSNKPDILCNQYANETIAIQ